MKNTESFLIDTVKTYCNLLHENKPLPAVKQRNENTELVSYNGKANTIFYNSDILFLSEPLVKTFLAHEVAHWAAGVEAQHGPEWVDACVDLEENLGDEIYEIYEHADNYDFESEFYNLEPGKLFNDLKNEFPDTEFKIGFNDYPLEWDDENNLLLITPTFFCADDESLFTEDEKEIIEEQKDYYREESGTMISESIEKTFENILRESVGPNLEMFLDRAFVEEYRMISRNLAEVRVRRTSEPLDSAKMAARFEDDIPEGYELKVKYLGPDSVLGKGWDTYEVSLERASLKDDELGIKISAEDTGGHEAGGLIDPIYKFKYEGLSDEYGNDIDGLCKYIKRHNRADNVTYTDEGDHYKIHATYKYTTHINRCPHTRTAECDLDLPKNYFGVSFMFNESIEQVFAQILKENKKFKEASFTIDEFCSYKGIENPEAFRDFLRKLWDFNHVEFWTQSDNDSLERALDKYQALREASVFKPSGFGLSGHYGYEAPEKEPVYVATETNEDDGELYFDETGCTTEFIEDAKKFVSEEQALEFAKDNVIFGTPGAKLRESDDTYKAKVNGKWLKGNSLVKDKKDADTFESKTEPTQRINQMKKDGKLDKNAKVTVLTESIDPTGAAFNLTKLKGYSCKSFL